MSTSLGLIHTQIFGDHGIVRLYLHVCEFVSEEFFYTQSHSIRIF